MNRFLCSTLLILLSFSSNYAQDYYEVSLRDTETGEPISFATIRFTGTARGIVADYYGQFRIPVDLTNDISTLDISSIGYRPLKIPVDQLSRSGMNNYVMEPQIETLETVVLKGNKRFKLTPAQLKEVIISSKELMAKDIVARAINAIPRNLSELPHSYIGYYRDYQMMDMIYYNLNEGIIEMFDQGIAYHDLINRFNQKALYSFKLNTEFQIDTSLSKNYDNRIKFVQNARIWGFGGNELTILNVHNPIRNFDENSFSFVYRMNKDFIGNHIFTKGDVLFLEDNPIITISFSANSGKKSIADPYSPDFFDNTGNSTFSKPTSISPNHDVVGTMRISLLDYAIHSFSYTVYDFDKSNPLFNVNIEYREIQDKMYLNYITFNNRFVVVDEVPFSTTKIDYVKERNTVDVTFNGEVDRSTIRKNRFKLHINEQRIPIKEVVLNQGNKIGLKLKYDLAGYLGFKDIDSLNIELELKRIKNTNGTSLNDRGTQIAYQFREFFTQEVFLNKLLDKTLQYMKKARPLYEAPLNRLQTVQPYFLNTPLKKRVMRN